MVLTRIRPLGRNGRRILVIAAITAGLLLAGGAGVWAAKRTPIDEDREVSVTPAQAGTAQGTTPTKSLRTTWAAEYYVVSNGLACAGPCGTAKAANATVGLVLADGPRSGFVQYQAPNGQCESAQANCAPVILRTTLYRERDGTQVVARDYLVHADYARTQAKVVWDGPIQEGVYRVTLQTFHAVRESNGPWGPTNNMVEGGTTEARIPVTIE